MATRYVSPGGSGTLCTFASPGAIAQIGLQAVPGDIWRLKDGTYSASGSVLFLDGNAGVADGTSGNHIRVTADNPGLAILQGDGDPGHVLRVNNLSYWDFDNLVVRNDDNPGNTGANASICGTFNSTNLTFKKCVFADNNTWGNNAGVTIQGNNILVEDCDVLRSHRNFLQAFGSTSFNITFRRCYISQPIADNSGSGPPDGFVFYSAHDCIIENCIAEDIDGYGFTGWGDDNSVYGSIALNCNDGGLFNGASSAIPGDEGDNFILENFLAIDIVSGSGVYLRPPHATVTGLTCLGCRVTVDGEYIDGGTRNVTITNALVKDYPSGSGFALNQGFGSFATKLLEFSHAWNTGAISGGWTLSNTPPNPPGNVNPNIGSYQISVPNAGAFKDKGKGGADVGANIYLTYQSGTLTGTFLWDFDNNKMAFGPVVVAGVNDSSTGNVRDTIGARLDLTVDEFSAPAPTEGIGSVAAGATLTGVGAFVAPEGTGTITAGAIFQGVGQSLAVEGIGSITAGAIFNGQAQFVTGAPVPGAPPVTLENPKTFTLRVKEARIGANGIVELELVREDLSIYDTVAQNPLLSSGTHGGAPAPTEPPVDDDSDQSKPGSTRLVLLDIPQLLFQHDGPGFYAAASGANDGWTGAILYEKIGTEFVEILQIGSRAAIGKADTRLDPGPVTTFDISGRTYVFDDVNTVDISLIDNVSILTSVTDTQLFAGVNAAALGSHGKWEIFSFGTATQLGPRQWRLSHLLRGMKGTEWAINMHGIGDGFVLLDQAIRRVNDAYTDLDISRTFKAISIGASSDSGNSVGFTNAGVSLKPLSPVFIRGEEDTVQNRTIRWYRRSRLNGLAGRDTYDPAPPLGESIERYEVDILNSAGTSVVRTITVSTESALYTAAQQTADHGSVPSSLNVCIYQLSETRGRGYAGCTTIALFDSVPSVLPGTHPVWILTNIEKKPRASQKPLIAPSVLVFFIPEDFVGSRATLEDPATASTVFSIKKNGIEIGTITFAAAGTDGAFAQVGTGDMSFNATSDKLTIVAPASQDATASGLGVSLLGYRIAA